MTPRYYALACQTIVHPIREDVKTRDEGLEIIKANMDAAVTLMWRGVGNHLGNIKLVCLPEMFLTLAPVGWRNRRSSEFYDIGCVEVPGSELEPLFEFARDAKVHVAANCYERDPRWPGRFFNCSFLIDPKGELVLKYRRVHSSVSSSPHDFLDEYVEEYGWDAIFPVADTELGRIAMFPCMEVVKPEVARMYALKGAEVLINPTNDSDDFPGWVACKQARALENNCYLISTNCGGWVTPRGYLESTNAGGTVMIDYMGNIYQKQLHAGESMKCRGLIDIEQLRAHRHSRHTLNYIPQLRTEVYTGYRKTVTPPNRFPTAMKDDSQLRNLYVETMDRLTKEGLFPRPIYDGGDD